MRGTFANVRIKNLMIPSLPDGSRFEGGETLFQPTGEQMSIYDAAMKYVADGTPTVVFGGEEYGTGSSRDWAAKGTLLLGVKAVVAESFERIHRSNLVGMGVLPLQFRNGENAQSLGLDGSEVIDITGLQDGASWRPAIGLGLATLLLAGAVYAGIATGFAGLAYPTQAEGSLLRDGSGQPPAPRRWPHAKA
ncbi:hypothetical protein G6F64_013712 [Rhizopus arrhizus]|uniref:Aconitase A/isopropylmalate dehydratase small subunit swivel domain-containing protein n=1 Tax=Rhizopus oryzae TaxID=64495 RepID=A0A9P7BKA3_RHIOR|nr:hypothetical protein G6F64_013712 [Rhizopus arrhizus]